MIEEDLQNAALQRIAIMNRLVALEVAMELNTRLTEQALQAAKDSAYIAASAAVDAVADAVKAAQEIKDKAEASYVLTEEIRDLLRAGKAGLSVLKYIGYVATPLVAIFAAYNQFFKHS